MKRHIKRFLCGLMAVCMLSAFMCASAAEQASYYLSSYTATLIADGNGEITVLVDVGATGRMTEIGASEIHIYESTTRTGLYECVESYYAEDYPEMLGSGTDYYDTPITYEGIAGRYYKAAVVFYAANSSGSDTGDYTTVACRAT